MLTSFGGDFVIGDDTYPYAGGNTNCKFNRSGQSDFHRGKLFDYNYNTALTNLTGLNNSTSIGGDLVIISNDALTNLSALMNLTFIGGDLSIGSNPVLINLTGLEGLSSVGNLWIYDNATLTSLEGLNNLNFIGGNLEIGIITGNYLVPMVFGKSLAEQLNRFGKFDYHRGRLYGCW